MPASLDKHLTIPLTHASRLIRLSEETPPPLPSPPPEGLDEAWVALIDRLEKDGFVRGSVEVLFARLGPESYSPAYMAAKVRELYGKKGISIKTEDFGQVLIPEGYEQPIADMTIGHCKSFMEEHKTVLKDIESKHGVPANVIIGLLLIETGLGRDLGSAPALLSLACMARTDTPEMLASLGNSGQTKSISQSRLKALLRERSDWAYTELKALLSHGEKNKIDLCRLPGSVYGAVGICQFMPSNIERYAVDGDGDGRIDLFNVVDAMYSVANYLEAHGWRSAKTQDQQLRVLYAYNRDYRYAASVLGVSNRLKLALKGKVADSRSPVAGVASPPPLDPSLKRQRPVPQSGKVLSLGSYQDILE